MFFFFFFKQKTAYDMRISDWSSDVCSSDLVGVLVPFIEEIIFRGLLFGWLRKHLPFVAAAPAAALLFAVAHQVWVLVPVLAFMGLVLAAVTERSGSLWPAIKSEEHTSELQSLMRISYAVFCLKKKNITRNK